MFPPGKHYVGVGVACAGARRAPLDSVDLFTVSLEVMDTGLLLHAPNLQVKATVKCAEVQSTMTSVAVSTKCYLQRHVIGAGGEQHARRIPLNGINFILPHTNLISAPLNLAGIV